MYKVRFYKDEDGNQPVLEYIKELGKTNGKDARVKLKKILDYINVLEERGKAAGEPYMKNLGDDIWELRPLRDRIFFVAWDGGSFVLLHHFQKKTQKTPKREIEKAKKEYDDLRERGL